MLHGRGYPAEPWRVLGNQRQMVKTAAKIRGRSAPPNAGCEESHAARRTAAETPRRPGRPGETPCGDAARKRRAETPCRRRRAETPCRTPHRSRAGGRRDAPARPPPRGGRAGGRGHRPAARAGTGGACAQCAPVPCRRCAGSGGRARLVGVPSRAPGRVPVTRGRRAALAAGGRLRSGRGPRSRPARRAPSASRGRRSARWGGPACPCASAPGCGRPSRRCARR